MLGKLDDVDLAIDHGASFERRNISRKDSERLWVRMVLVSCRQLAKVARRAFAASEMAILAVGTTADIVKKPCIMPG